MAKEKVKESALSRALKLICKTPKTEKEIKDYLFKKEYPYSEIKETMARLKELNYINDEVYAKFFTEVKSRKIGKNLINVKLMQKGVNKDLAKQTTAEITNAEEVAAGLAEKYMASGKRNKEQLYRYLLSKGFDYEVCSKVVKGDDWD